MLSYKIFTIDIVKKDVKTPNMLCVKSSKLKNDFTEQDINDLAYLHNKIRNVFKYIGVNQVGFYLEGEDNFLEYIIPYYEKTLNAMGIDPDNYQPKLKEYIFKFLPVENIDNVVLEHIKEVLYAK
ncbi:MAG TPA: hypothetical protein IAB72_01410 [Candidatus Onthoplasma faecipullorum]|nr:hypothetical protein [Candidatus Onthoplasma faecipullorum]